MKKNDPYAPELWAPKVDVVIRPPNEPPKNFYFLGRPMQGEYYDGPPKEQTRLLRKPLSSFGSQQQADKWALENYRVVEVLHTARIFCWRVMRDD